MGKAIKEKLIALLPVVLKMCIQKPEKETWLDIAEFGIVKLWYSYEAMETEVEMTGKDV